jgi:predicted kinase
MEVLIMVGPPGSGKSTFIQQQKDFGWKVIVCSADHFFIDEKTGAYNFDASKLGAAHRECFKRYHSALDLDGYLNPDYVIVDNTNLFLEHITPYTMLADMFGVPFRIVKFDIDPEVCASRNVHGVPRDKVLQMAERAKKMTFPKNWNVQVING